MLVARGAGIDEHTPAEPVPETTPQQQSDLPPDGEASGGDMLDALPAWDEADSNEDGSSGIGDDGDGEGDHAAEGGKGSDGQTTAEPDPYADAASWASDDGRADEAEAQEPAATQQPQPEPQVDCLGC